MIGPFHAAIKTMKKLPIFGLLAAVSLAGGVHAQPPQQLAANLADLELEQLTQVTVTSASRREERLVEAPASIFVITAEDIRRAGVSTLPEALRLAPNLQVVRADGSQHIVTARGGLAGTANKMLVLVDGRTVYTPLFSGVFYDALAIMLEDVERIEVISGPGSTLWGTNAVNGVINVTTKPARDTRGGLLAAGAGNQERGASARFGWAAGQGGALRTYARHYDRDDFRLASGASARDASSRWQAGARGDWQSAVDSWTVQGDVYGAHVDNLGGVRDMLGGNLLGRYRRMMGSNSELMLQGYWDRTEREHAGSFDERRDTFDVEGHYATSWGSHKATWGSGYRASRDSTAITPALAFMPPDRTLTILSAFVQDELAVSSTLRATLGLRAERNTYTGWEWLPNARLSYTLSPDGVIWSALTRTVRSPSRLDRDLVVPGMPPFVVVNNDTFSSEVAQVAELGYRGNFGSRVSVSLTAFHHRYEELRTLEPAGAGLVIANGAEGRLNGLEAWGELRPSQNWRLVWGWAAMRERTELLPGRVNLTDAPLGNNPRRTASLRSLWNVTPAVQLDLMLRHVSRLPNPEVPSYTQLNGRIGWRALPELDLSLVAVNVLDRDHVEFGAPAQRAVFEPGYFLKATWAF
jgi:iron complex outermembrane receptor protein